MDLSESLVRVEVQKNSATPHSGENMNLSLMDTMQSMKWHRQTVSKTPWSVIWHCFSNKEPQKRILGVWRTVT